jgi:ATP-dependent RNA helicase RhlB
MNNPVDLKTTSDQIAADKVEQCVYHPASDEKIPLLIGLMQKLQPQRSIIFVNTKRAADKVHASLLGNNINADVLSGDVRQKKRQRLITELADGSLTTLIATDVAARGLHIEGVTHVFNFDLPQNAEDYVHRIGRTARAGADGQAISFACEEYVFSLPEIEELLGNEIPASPITNDIIVTPAPPKKIQRNKPAGQSRNGNNRGGNGRGGNRRGKRRRPDARKKPQNHSADAHSKGNQSGSQANSQTSKETSNG